MRGADLSLKTEAHIYHCHTHSERRGGGKAYAESTEEYRLPLYPPPGGAGVHRVGVGGGGERDFP